MKLIHRAALACIVTANVAIVTTSHAQNATASTNITCVQSGASMTCTQQPVVFTLPSGVNLVAQTSGSGFTLNGNISGPVAPASCSISINPATPTVAIGGTATLSVGCQVGSGSYTYVWTKDGNAINGATAASYQLSPTDTATPGSATYGVTVTNGAGSSSASRSVLVQAATPPSGCSVTALPATTVPTGATPTLSVQCASGTSPFTYQWTKGGNAILNATGQSYTLSSTIDTSAASTTQYVVNVSNSAGTSSPGIQIVVTSANTTTCPSGTLYSVMSSTNSSYVDSNGQYGSTPWAITMDVASTNTTQGVANLPQLWFYETPGSTESYKQVTISSSPCNFNNNPEFVLSAPSSYNQGGVRLIMFNDTRAAVYPRLNTGRWYINVRNLEGECTGQCNTRVQLVR